MKKLILIIMCVFLAAPILDAAKKKSCDPNKSKPCGDTCIAKDKECHKDMKTTKKKNCDPKKSKPCGDTCIPLKNECKMDKK